MEPILNNGISRKQPVIKAVVDTTGQFAGRAVTTVGYGLDQYNRYCQYEIYIRGRVDFSSAAWNDNGPNEILITEPDPSRRLTSSEILDRSHVIYSGGDAGYYPWDKRFAPTHPEVYTDTIKFKNGVDYSTNDPAEDFWAAYEYTYSSDGGNYYSTFSFAVETAPTLTRTVKTITDNAHYTLPNDPAPGDAVKVDAGDTSLGLPGAVFHLQNRTPGHRFENWWYNGPDSWLQGADPATPVGSDITSGEGGMITLPSLPKGRYLLKETIPPPGHQLDGSEEYWLDVSADGRKLLTTTDGSGEAPFVLNQAYTDSNDDHYSDVHSLKGTDSTVTNGSGTAGANDGYLQDSDRYNRWQYNYNKNGTNRNFFALAEWARTKDSVAASDVTNRVKAENRQATITSGKGRLVYAMKYDNARPSYLQVELKNGFQLDGAPLAWHRSNNGNIAIDNNQSIPTIKRFTPSPAW